VRKAEIQYVAEQMRLHTLTGAHVVEFCIVEHAPIDSRTIREIEWPAECVVTSIRRGGQLVVPRDETVLRPGS
jgi:Trk K+ transport system NAD-binding subunit